MSKEHRPTHINKWTYERLENREQICSACHMNFANSESGDAHRLGEFGKNRMCVPPPEVGLIETKNKYQSTVWRIQNDID